MTSHPFHYDPPKARLCDSEIAIQKQCLAMVAALFPRSRAAAVPNAGKRSQWAAQRAKAEGLSKGFPDLIIAGHSGLRPVLGVELVGPLTAYCEIKAQSSLTPEQTDWLNFLHASGHHCGVFRSDKTLEAKLKEWGFM